MAEAYSAEDHTHMARALRLAARGLYTATPNPRVGCVLVKDGKVVGEGWHEAAGQPHAEVHALAAAGAAAAGATAYVSLEPCSHTGRTPPCADALLGARVARVVAAMEDPNPKVAGRGLARLRAAGVGVSCGLMEAEARALNAGFVSRMTRERPFVRLKIAATLDGRIALANGASRWITGEAARRDVHRWRARSCAILTGVGTALADDPLLNVREVKTSRQPLKVIVDTHLSLTPGARLLSEGRTLVATASRDGELTAALEARGAEVLRVAGGRQAVDLPRLLTELARREINEVMVEAGRTLCGSFLDEGLVDELLFYMAPTVLGDKARGMFGMREITELAGRRDFDLVELRQLGRDLRLTLRPVALKMP